MWWFEGFYFLQVRPFLKLILPTLLKGMLSSIERHNELFNCLRYPEANIAFSLVNRKDLLPGHVEGWQTRRHRDRWEKKYSGQQEFSWKG
jgi:hypothetical protein